MPDDSKEDSKEILGRIEYLLGQIQRDTHKMTNHINRVEKHITWIEKISTVLFPSLYKMKTKQTDHDILDSVV